MNTFRCSPNKLYCNFFISILLLILLLFTTRVVLAEQAVTSVSECGKGLELDGINDFVNIPDFTLGSEFTIESWVKLASGIDYRDGIFGNGSNMHLYFVSGKARLYAFGVRVTANTAISEDTWAHIALTRSGTKLTLYVNGVEDATGSWNGTFSIKSLGKGYRGYFKGMMDEVRIWNVTRTDAEIGASYDTTVDPNAIGLIGYWNFNGADQIISDATSLANHASLGASTAIGTDDPVRLDSTAPVIENCDGGNTGGNSNVAPVANDDTAGSVVAGGTLSIAVTDNDVDNDDNLDSSSVEIVTIPGSGTASVDASGKITYISTGTTATNDTLTYTVKDTAGEISNEATVSITVIEPSLNNQIPVAEVDSATVQTGEAVTIDVLTNDNDNDGTLDNNSLVVVSDPNSGTVDIDLNTGEITYTHDGSAAISDSFTYTIEDNDGAESNEATVSITITNLAAICGKGIELDGINDFVNIPDLTLGSDFTVEAWVKVAPGIDYRDGLFGNGSNMHLYFVSGKARLYAFGTRITANTAILADTWAHIALTRSGTNLTLFVNGVEDSTGNWNGAFSVKSLGQGYRGYFKGMMDEVRIWNVARTGAEIGASYDTTVTSNAPGLIGYWNFNDSDQIITDASSSVNHASLGANIAIGTDDPVRLDSTAPVIENCDGGNAGGNSNVAPVANDDTAGSVVAGGTLSIAVTDNDVDNDDNLDSSSVEIVTIPGSGTASVDASGKITYISTATTATTDTLTYTVKDTAGEISNEATVTITVTEPTIINVAPIANDDVVGSVEAGGTLNFTVTDNDEDNNDNLNATSVVIVTAPNDGIATVNPSGTIMYVNTGSTASTDTLTYTVADTEGAVSNEATVSITISEPTPINQSPVTQTDTAIVQSGEAATINVLSNDSDNDGTLEKTSLFIVNQPSSGTVEIDFVTGSITYTHDGSATSSDSFIYTVKDNLGAVSNESTVLITINSVASCGKAIELDGSNDWINIPDLTLAGDFTIESWVKLAPGIDNKDALFGQEGSGSDMNFYQGKARLFAGGDRVTANTALLADTWGHIAISRSAGSLTLYVNGVEDATGSWNGILSLKALGRGNRGYFKGMMDEIRVWNIARTGAEISASYNTDVDPNSLGLIGYWAFNELDQIITDTTSSVNHGSLGANTVIGTDDPVRLDSTAPLNESCDSGNSNVPPVANDDTAVSVQAGETISFTVTGNDTDNDGNLDSTSVAIVFGPSNGTATIDASGTINYTNTGITATSDTLTYTVKDTAGEISNEATVLITVTEPVTINVAPVANDDTVGSVEAGGIATFTVTDNDVDSDGNLNSTSVVIVTAPSDGMATVNLSGIITYINTGSIETIDTLTYTVADTEGLISNEATVSITVTEPTSTNAIPVTQTDTAIVQSGEAATINVLSNDSDSDGTLDKTSLFIVNQPSSGTVEIDFVTGSITYTHDGSATSSDSFIYTVKDNLGAVSNESTVLITINSVASCGKGIELDGSNDWVNIPDLTLSGDFTIEGWVKLAPGIDNNDALFGQEGAGSDINFYQGKARLFASGDRVTANTALLADTWGHIAIIRSGSSLTLYVNGIEDATGTWNGALSLKAIGRGNRGYFKGMMDEIRVWNVARTGAEINASYDIDVDPNLPGLIGYWAFNEIDQNITDTSSLANHGSLGANTVIGTDDPVRLDSTAPLNESCDSGNSNVPPVANDDTAISVQAGETISFTVTGNDVDSDGNLNPASVVIVTAPSEGTATVDAFGAITYINGGTTATIDTLSYTVADTDGVISNIATVFFTVVQTPVSDTLSLHGLFSDHAVLQRGVEVPVWGTAGAGATINVSFVGQNKQAIADNNGQWMVKLDSLVANATGETMTVTSGEQTETRVDILVGEVWLASGQSNMALAMFVADPANPPTSIPTLDGDPSFTPSVRLMAMNVSGTSSQPSKDFSGGEKWKLSDRSGIYLFSSVAYYFGRELNNSLNVPIGMITGTAGGTSIRRWMPDSALQPDSCSESSSSINYNYSIAPLLPYAIKGVIWYQGESNAVADRDDCYHDDLKSLIESWRVEWATAANNPSYDFPFYFVQLPNFEANENADSWVNIREQMLNVNLDTAQTEMVVTIDVGDPNDVHPTLKLPVGKRLARVARALDYGENIVYSGPVYKSLEVIGSTAILTFNHIGSGLISNDGLSLKYFEIAGSDGVYHNGQAAISGNTVEVSSNQVSSPVKVRYAWRTNPENPNFANQEGLMATPFRTDAAFFNSGGNTNVAPVANNDTVDSVQTGTSISITVTDNDIDSDGNIDPTSVSIVSVPSEGTATVDGFGTITYTSTGTTATTDMLSYTVADSEGMVSNEATVVISIIDSSPISPSTFYVSTMGDDSNPGTVGEPFKTLEQARSAVAAYKQSSGLPDQGIAVILREGVYQLGQSFNLGSADSGAQGKPIVYQSEANETATITGSQPLDPTKFSVVDSSSAIWNRLDDAAKSNVLQIDLGGEGISNFGVMEPRNVSSNKKGTLHLYFDNKPMTLARWPDKPTEDSPKNHNISENGFTNINQALSNTAFTYTNDRADRWTQANDIWLHGFFKFHWADYHVPVTNLDTNSKTMTVIQPGSLGIGDGQPFYAYNLLEEITEPGEWYLDRTSGILYFWPPADINSKTISVSMMDTNLIEMNNASWIIFKDIVIEGGRAGLIKMTGGSHNVIQNSILRNSGSVAAIIDGTESGIEDSEIAYTGDGGIIVKGGNRVTLQRADNFIRNNEIHHFGQWVYGYKGGIKVEGIGQTISNNTLYQSPHVAIQWEGNEHLIEKNEMHDVVRFASDMGAMYSGRNWGWRGNVVKNNFIHDIYSWAKQADYEAHGVYLDDALSGTTVFGNIFYRIHGHGILNGGGRDNILENNVFAYCGVPLLTDNRAVNALNFIQGNSWNLIGRIVNDGIDYKAEPWASKYPELAEIPMTFATQDPSVRWLYPEGSVFKSNISFGGNPDTRVVNGIFDLDRTIPPVNSPISYFEEVSNNIDGQDPLFVNEGSLDLNLQPSSPAFSIPGFQAIPFNQIGVQ